MTTENKAGARNSMTDQQHLNMAHDHMVAAGANCPPDKGEENKSDDLYAVKFVGDNEVEGYSVLWGSAQQPDGSKKRDYFTPDTNFWLDRLSNPKPITHHHGFDEVTKSDPVVASVLWEKPDDIGIKYRARLRDTNGFDEYMKSLDGRRMAEQHNLEAEGKATNIDWAAWERKEREKARAHDEYVKNLMERTRNLVRQGAFKTSSDSVPQYVQREAQSNGTNWVKVWPLVSLAWTTIPAEPRMRAIAEVKAEYKSIGVEFPSLEADPEAGNGGNAANEQDAAAKANQIAKEKEMEDKQIQEAVAKALAEAKAKEEADNKLKAEINQQIEAKAKELFDAKMAEAAKTGRGLIFSNGSKIEVKSKYDDLPLDVATFLRVLRGKTASEELNRAVAAKSFKAIEEGKLEAKAMEDAEFKANEVMQSTLTSYGDEWVTTQFSSQLWLKVRAKSRLMGFIPEQEIPKGYESNTIPLESTDFTFYNVSQTSAEDGTMKTPAASITSSRVGTAQRVITVGKLGARGEVSGELDEDSIIDALPNALAQLQRQLPEELDFVGFNADDTAATSNINGNGSPTSGADYTLWKGLMVLGLTTNTANKTDASAALTSAKVRAFYRTLGTNGMYAAQDPSLCRVFCDYATWWTVMGLSDLLTVANAGGEATIRNGADADGGIPIHGIKWYPTSGVKLAQSTGIRHSATNAEDGSDILGRAVLVRSDQWQMRWKRRFKLETLRIPRSDITEVVATMRFGLGYFDTDASAVLYNINIS